MRIFLTGILRPKNNSGEKVMVIKSLKLKNFRNYSEETFEFSDGVNIISGAIAQGKTNCAEAIFYL